MKLFQLTFFLLVSFSCQAQNEMVASKIDSLFQHINLSTPGYMIGVIKDSDFILKRSYGSANLEHNIPVSAHSAFNVASLSKQFTAASIALLMLENKISLDDKVAHFLPDFAFAESDMRIKHLIYMCSGINDYYYNPRSNGLDWSSL